MDIKYISYCKCKCRNGTNFGDMITPYIYYKKTGKKAITKNIPRNKDFLIGSGSIIGTSNRNSIIWGTGIMFGTEKFPKPKKILSVRGPLTRKRCLDNGIDCPEIYGDIGLLLPKFYNPKIKKKYKIGYVPHYIDYQLCIKINKDKINNNITIIDITNNIENVIEKILECEFIISTSLHGIIASHAYNIKCAWGKISNKILGGKVKYLDYYKSIGINDDINPIMIDKYIEENKLLNIIEKYNNPAFPINTDEIMKLCPF